MLIIQTKEDLEFRRMIDEINSNDITALERHSRWLIWAAEKNGEFKAVSDEMRQRLDWLIDTCKDSL